MRKILLTSKEPNQPTALEAAMVPNGSPKHRVRSFERIKERSLRERAPNVKLNLAADASQFSKMLGKNDSDHSDASAS